MSDVLLLEGAIAPAANPNLFGHDSAQHYLAETYRSGKGHHAILLEGAEGIGKATLAFRFANHILHHPVATKAPQKLMVPDPDSPITRQMISGASHDLLHLQRPVDAKTGKVKTAITVDEVRRAGRFFSQTSGTGNWRIVVVDAADDLNRNAANAILKILEEPPRNAMFLLISHAPGRLLPTIRSRCLPLRLRPLDTGSLDAALQALGVSPGSTDIETLDRLAGGSVAQALKLLNYGGADIIAAYEEIMRSPGVPSRPLMHKLADALAKRENETIQDFFFDYLDTDIKQRARNAAMSGDLERAAGLADLAVAISASVGEARAFNLDQKQLLLDTLSGVQDALIGNSPH